MLSVRLSSHKSVRVARGVVVTNASNMSRPIVFQRIVNFFYKEAKYELFFAFSMLGS